jgi:anaerobic magnesium-protoporphyrin IX monomethyl ester cyclase
MGFESFLSGYTIGNGILSIAAVTRIANHDVILDLGNEENIMELVRHHSPDIVGFTCLTVSYPTVRNMINMIKAYNPRILTVIGGHHVTFMTKEVFAECKVDYIFRGEGEIAFPLLVNAIEQGNRYPIIEGVVFRKDNRLFNEMSFTLLHDLDTLPRIPVDLIPRSIKNYVPVISTSRGCPFRCSFCSISSFYGSRWRPRKVVKVLDDIETYTEVYHLKRFSFNDDNFLVDTNRVRELCDGLNERGLDHLKWSCNGRVDTICRVPELVNRIQDVGCVNMQLGIESGVQEIIDSYRKQITLHQVQKAVKIMNDSSIFHSWYMIIGSGDEYDSEKYLEQNIAFMKKIQFDLLSISILTPFPGTPLYTKLTNENRLLHRDWRKYDCTHCVYQPLHLSPQQIEEFFIKAYKTLNFGRDSTTLFKVAWKSLRSGLAKSSYLLKAVRYYVDVFVRNKNIYEIMDSTT